MHSNTAQAFCSSDLRSFLSSSTHARPCDSARAIATASVPRPKVLLLPTVFRPVSLCTHFRHIWRDFRAQLAVTSTHQHRSSSLTFSCRCKSAQLIFARESRLRCEIPPEARLPSFQSLYAQVYCTARGGEGKGIVIPLVWIVYRFRAGCSNVLFSPHLRSTIRPISSSCIPSQFASSKLPVSSSRRPKFLA